MQPPRGMHDLLPEVFKIHKYITETALVIGQHYGFQPMSTPLVESLDVFHRSLGDVSDIVSKEMYELIQKGSERLVIRPEGTAGIARSVISNGLTQSLPLKFISYGPMFRYERPQKGRTRQFHQISVELFGFPGSLGDLEVITMAYDFLRALGLEKRVTLELNTLGDKESRDAYRTALVDYFTGHKGKLSRDSLVRLGKNPLRILDSKDEGDRAIITDAPLLQDHLNETSRKLFDEVKEGLDTLGIPYKLNPHLVRGLDYYCHVAFEFTTDELGSQSAVLAGGRYDGLMALLGGPEIPGVGWACGLERLALMIDAPEESNGSIALIIGDEDGRLKGILIAHGLRNAGFTVEPIPGNNLGKQLKKADKSGAQYALIMGSDEMNRGEATVKNLKEGSQNSVPFGQLTPYFQKELS